MPLNEQGNLSYRDFIGKTGSDIAGALGFSPYKYGKYFSGYESIKPELDFIQSGFESALGNAQSQGSQNMFELATGARGMEGQSGFSNFGAIQKSLGQTQGALQDIMRKNIAQQELSKNQQIYGAQQSFFEKALNTAMQLLQSGAEADWVPQTTDTDPDYNWGGTPLSDTGRDSTDVINVKKQLSGMGQDTQNSDAQAFINSIKEPTISRMLQEYLNQGYNLSQLQQIYEDYMQETYG